MRDRIIVCGGNGAGKSTLGPCLARRLGCPFRDIEDYWFPKTDPGNPYGEARRREEVAALLLADLERPEGLVLAAVKGDFGPAVEGLFTCAVLVEVPKVLRMERIRDRSRRKFGDRMALGGDLYRQEREFFRMAEARSQEDVTAWLAKTGLPVVRVDGTRPPAENTRAVLRWLVDSGPLGTPSPGREEKRNFILPDGEK